MSGRHAAVPDRPHQPGRNYLERRPRTGLRAWLRRIWKAVTC